MDHGAIVLYPTRACSLTAPHPRWAPTLIFTSHTSGRQLIVRRGLLNVATFFCEYLGTVVNYAAIGLALCGGLYDDRPVAVPGYRSCCPHSRMEAAARMTSIELRE